MLLPVFRAVMVGPPNIVVATPACIGACISKYILQSSYLEESLAMLVLDERKGTGYVIHKQHCGYERLTH